MKLLVTTREPLKAQLVKLDIFMAIYHLAEMLLIAALLFAGVHLVLLIQYLMVVKLESVLAKVGITPSNTSLQGLLGMTCCRLGFGYAFCLLSI